MLFVSRMLSGEYERDTLQRIGRSQIRPTYARRPTGKLRYVTLYCFAFYHLRQIFKDSY